MAENNTIQGFMDNTLKNLKTMIDVNTVVGDAITAPDGTIIIPVSTVGFGFGAGGSEFGQKKGTPTENGAMFGGGCGGGVSIKPTAFLVVSGTGVRLIPVSSSTTMTERIINLVPEMLDRVNTVFSEAAEKKAEKEKEKAQNVNVVDLDY